MFLDPLESIGINITQRNANGLLLFFKYKINKANTERYKNSSIPYMQRLLNDDSKKRKREMIDLNIELSNSKKRRQGE